MGRKTLTTREAEARLTDQRRVNARPNEQELAKPKVDLSLFDLRQRKDEACEALIRLYHGRIYNYLYHLCGHAEMAEDLCQETFVKVWRNLEGFAGRSNLSTWMMTIARNTFIDELRRRRIPTVSLDGACLDVADQSAGPGAAAGEEERERILRARIMELPEREKTALLLHYMQGLTYVETARVLRIATGTAKYYVSRGLGMLRERLKGEGFET